MSAERFPISKEPAELDVYDVAAAYSEEQGGAPEDRSVLGRWIARYPQFAAELSAIAYDAFATGESIFDTVDNIEPSAAVEDVARSFILSRGAQDAAAPLAGITAEAQAQGLIPKQLAIRLRIDAPLLAKLDQRLIDVSTVPALLLRMLSEAIGRTVDDITAYLAGPPRMATQAHYKADEKPRVDTSGKQTFTEALTASPKISEEDREFWRVLKDDAGS